MKIFITDLDGTLLNNASHVSDYSKKVVADFTRAGNLLVPASGRPLLSIQKLLRDEEIESSVRYIIAYNGALVWEREKNSPLWSACVDFESARIIQNTCFDLGIHIQTYNNETVLTPCEDDEIRYYTRRIFLPVEYTDDPIGACDTEPYKLLAIDLNNHDKLCQLIETLSPQINDKVNMVFSSKSYLEFFNKKAGKGSGIGELCKLLNYPISDTLAAGDEENDISMLKTVGRGIAMRNATVSVKASADAISEYDNEQDGLAKLLLTV